MKIAGWALIACLLPSAALAGLSSSERKSEFEKALSLVLSAALPNLPAASREQRIKDYQEAKENKAQAIEPVGGNTWRSINHESRDVVGQRTLEGCQIRYNLPCALIAINEEIASEGAIVSKPMERVAYAGKFDAQKIPAIRLALRNRADVQNYDRAMLPKAMAIHPQGRLYIAAGNATLKDAEASALASCNGDPSRKGRDGPCYLYAVNNDVVLAQRLRTAE